ncbi:J domain-containing protein [Candidatus Saccharibacteria bacterium]|nr:J domain-containing protein [Candidatus Saccharibacteria bacterium]
MAKTYYDELGLEPKATAADIKRQYRVLAREKHPDAATGSDKAFVKLQQAYDVLSDKDKRRVYDDFLASEKPKTTVVTASAATAAAEPTSASKTATPAPQAKKRWRPSWFQWLVTGLVLFIVVLFVRVAASWSGGVGPLATPQASTVDSPSPSPSPPRIPSPSPGA